MTLDDDGPKAEPQRIEALPVRLRGSSLALSLLHLFGWRLQNTDWPGPQGLLIVYPHTSNWDFIIAMLAKWSLGIPVTFLGKDTLFRVPLFGRWLRWIGGRPVVRSHPQGAVGQIIDEFRKARDGQEFMWLGLSPEGTRKLMPSWRSGFYQVAVQADVPVAVGFIDYREKRVGIDSIWRFSGNQQADQQMLQSVLAHRVGYHPQQAAPISWAEAPARAVLATEQAAERNSSTGT